MFLFWRHLQVSLCAFPNLTQKLCAGASKEGLSRHPRPAGQEGRRASVVPSPKPHAWIQDVPPPREPWASSASGQGRVQAQFGGLLGCTDTLAECQDCLPSRTHEQRGGEGSVGPLREQHRSKEIKTEPGISLHGGWAGVADSGMDGWDRTDYSHTSSLHPLRHTPNQLL